MTRSEQIASLKRQKSEVVDKIRLLEAKRTVYSEEYIQLKDKWIEQYKQLKQLQEFNDFCESIPESFLANVIDSGFLGFQGSLVVSLIAGRWFSPFIAASIVGGIGSIIRTPIDYYSLKKNAMIGDLLDFDMEQYDVSERMKGVECAQDFMCSMTEIYKCETLDIDFRMKELVKRKLSS